MPRYKRYRKKKNFKKNAKTYKSYKWNKKAYKEYMLYDPMSGGQPFRSKYFTKLTGTLTGRLAAATLADQILPIKMNSVYLPFEQCTAAAFTFPSITTTSYQMAGFNNIFNVNLYNYYRVLGCRIDIDLQPDDIADVMNCTITPTNNIGFPTNVREATEQKFTVLGVFGNGRDPVITTMSGRQMPKAKSLTSYMTTARFLGVPKKAVEYDLSQTYTGTYTSDPLGLHYWAIWMNPLDGVATTSPVAFRISVVYYVEAFGFVHPSN